MFTKVSTVALAALSTLTAVSARALDVWDPRITSPVSPVNVTWDTSDAPALISNGARVALARGGIFLPSDSPGSVDQPLAQDFDLRAGWVTVTPPDIAPADNYEVVLFGDSGNIGQDFSIVAA